MIKEIVKKTPIIGTWATQSHAALNLFLKRRRQKRFFERNRQVLAKNAELKNSCAGKRVFILSGGPSIKDQNLNGLENELCISISNFFVHPAFPKIKPRFHVFPSSHNPITDEQYLAWFDDAEKHFTPEQNVIMSLTDKYMLDIRNPFKTRNIFFYSTNEHDNKIFKRDIDFTKRVPPIQTAAHWAIYLAIYLGCKEIYLLGCDHNWYLGGHSTDEKSGKMISKHFYDYKDYALARAGYVDTPQQGMAELFTAYQRLWKIYAHIKKHADERDVKIINATPGSLLDVFPRADLSEVVDQK